MSTPGPMRTLGKVKKGAKTAGSAPGGGDKPPDKPYQKPTPAPEVDVPSSEEEDEEEEEDQNTKYTDRYSVMPPKGGNLESSISLLRKQLGRRIPSA